MYKPARVAHASRIRSGSRRKIYRETKLDCVRNKGEDEKKFSLSLGLCRVSPAFPHDDTATRSRTIIAPRAPLATIFTARLIPIFNDIPWLP